MMAYYGDQGNEDYGGKWEPRRSSGGGMSDLPYWILALVFLFAFPPVGVLMIALRLFGGGKRRVARGRHPYYMQRDGQAPVGARTTVSEPARSQEKTGRREKKRQEGKAEQDMSPVCLDVVEKMAKRGRRLIQVGGIITAVFAFTVLACLGDASYWLLHGDAIWFWDQLLNAIPLLCFLGGGAGVLWAGLRKKKQVRTYRNYLAMIGRRQTISISTLASATGASPAKVRDCLEDMLDDGLFPLGFLDYGGDRLVLSGEGLNDPAPAQEEKTEEKKAAPVDEENAVLAEIRAVNDSIEDAALSAQIDRIGVITAKIFEYQKSHPERSAQLHAFLSYYLPTTLKILRAYAQLESQGVEGENIAAAMSRIEGMMGKVVEGFEKQLDQLFQGDAMDITTDVAVLEQMLQKDGLSSSGGMQIGI